MSKRVKFIVFHRFYHFYGNEKGFIISFTGRKGLTVFLLEDKMFGIYYH